MVQSFVLPLVYAFVIHIIIHQKIIDSRNKKDIDRKKEKVIIKKKKGTKNGNNSR